MAIQLHQAKRFSIAEDSSPSRAKSDKTDAHDRAALRDHITELRKRASHRTTIEENVAPKHRAVKVTTYVKDTKPLENAEDSLDITVTSGDTAKKTMKIFGARKNTQIANGNASATESLIELHRDERIKDIMLRRPGRDRIVFEKTEVLFEARKDNVVSRCILIGTYDGPTTSFLGCQVYATMLDHDCKDKSAPVELWLVFPDDRAPVQTDMNCEIDYKRFHFEEFFCGLDDWPQLRAFIKYAFIVAAKKFPDAIKKQHVPVNKTLIDDLIGGDYQPADDAGPKADQLQPKGHRPLKRKTSASDQHGRLKRSYLEKVNNGVYDPVAHSKVAKQATAPGKQSAKEPPNRYISTPRNKDKDPATDRPPKDHRSTAQSDTG